MWKSIPLGQFLQSTVHWRYLNHRKNKEYYAPEPEESSCPYSLPQLPCEIWEIILLNLGDDPNDYYACFSVSKLFCSVLKKNTPLLKKKLSTLIKGDEGDEFDFVRLTFLPNGVPEGKLSIGFDNLRYIIEAVNGKFHGKTKLVNLKKRSIIAELEFVSDEFIHGQIFGIKIEKNSPKRTFTTPALNALLFYKEGTS